MQLTLATSNVWGLPWPLSIHKRKRFEGLISIINTFQIDCIALQEVWVNADIEYLRNNLPGYHVFDSRNFFFNHSGLVTISRFPLGNGSLVPFKGSMKSLEFPSRKGVLSVDATIHGKNIRLVNTHLYFSTTTEQHAKHQRQLNELVVQLDRRPTILFGDFNMPKEEILLGNSFAPISETKGASIEKKNPYSRALFNKLHHRERLPDYIFTNFPVQVKDKTIVRDPFISDHYPIISIVEL
jgi:endonuclease/exonuclease/phosphatase family metal-dependent hydrolase